jgi:hypothetical protein
MNKMPESIKRGLALSLAISNHDQLLEAVLNAMHEADSYYISDDQARAAISVTIEAVEKMVEKWDTMYIDTDGTIHHSGIGKMIADEFCMMLKEGDT